MPDAAPLEIRAIRASEVDSFVELLVGEGESLGGSRSALPIRAVARDAARPDGRAVIVVASDGEVRAAIVVLLGGSWAYWRRFPLRHPIAGAHLASRRIRKRVRAALGRRGRPSGRAAAPSDGSRSASPGALPDGLRDDPRLAVPMAPRGTGPHLRDEGPDHAFGALVIVGSDLRNQGIGTRLHHAAFPLLRERGIQRYDTSFLLDYEPSIRMYLSLGFDVHRTPSGFFGTYDLRDTTPEEP